MPNLLEALAYLDIIDRIDGFASTFRFADWEGAFQRAGVAGIVTELLACLAARNCWTIWIPRHAGWSGVEVEQLLMRHGVRIWGRGFVGDEIYFRVKKRQARWAEYLLLRRRVPVTSGPFDKHNLEYTERYAPGSEPPSHHGQQQSDPDWIEQLLSFLR